MDSSFFFTIDSIAYAIFFSVFALLSLIPIFAKSSRLDFSLFVIVACLAYVLYTSMGHLTVDQYMYVAEFHSLGKYETFPWGYGFYWLLRGIAFFSKSDQAYVCGTTFAAIILYAAAIFLNVPRNYRALCLILFVMHFDFFDLITNVYRQCVASAIVLIAFYFLRNKRFFYFLLLSLLASSFHWSAITAFFIMVVGYLTRNSSRIVLILATASLVAGVVAIFTASSLTLNADSFRGLGGLFQALGNVKLDEKLNSYVGGGLDNAHFSDLGIAGRVKYLIDISCALGMIVYALLKQPAFMLKVGDVQLFSTYTLLTIYNILFLGMAWFFRNSYWSFVFLPLLVIGFLCRCQENCADKVRIYLVGFLLIYIMFSIFTMWRSPILSINSLRFPV